MKLKNLDMLNKTLINLKKKVNYPENVSLVPKISSCVTSWKVSPVASQLFSSLPRRINSKRLVISLWSFSICIRCNSSFRALETNWQNQDHHSEISYETVIRRIIIKNLVMSSDKSGRQIRRASNTMNCSQYKSICLISTIFLHCDSVMAYTL